MSGPAPLAWNAAAARFSKARSDTGIELVRAWADALPRGARVLLLGGAVADGPRHIWWNFVASSKDRIDAAKEAWAKGDWEGGMFSLPPDDDDEFIPAPDGEPGTKASFVP